MKLGKIKILSFLLVIALIITFIPQGALTVSAEDTIIEYTTEAETEIGEETGDDWIIDDSFIQEIVPPDSDVSINSWLDQPSLYEPIGGGLTYLPDGVYALQNFGNSGFCVGILNDLTDAGGTVVQVASTSVTGDFDRSCLFKITRVGETTRYVIRSMLNNRLILSYNGSKFVTKEVSPNDADISSNDTFIILGASAGGYTITPYGGTQVMAAPNSTASDTSSAALIKTNATSAGNRGKWTFMKYVGETKSGISIPISPTNWNYGAKVGTTYTLKLKTWTTEIGANTPYLTVHPDYTDMATYSWNSSTYTLTVTPTKEGPIGIRSIIRRDGTTTAFRTYKSVYSIVPELNDDTAFIQNVGTSRYIDLESASMVEGGIIQQWSFHTGTQAQWIFEVAYGGFFYIKSLRSGMYIGVDQNNTTSVKQYATKNSYTQWRLKKTSSGNFALYCNAIESGGTVLSTPLSTSGNGVDLTMLAYVDDTNYSDEWKTIAFPVDVSLIALPETYDRSSYFDEILNSLKGIGYDRSYDNDTIVNNTNDSQVIMSESELLHYMRNSKITLIRTHGNKTLIRVGDGHITTTDLSSFPQDYFNYSELIIYGACLTAAGGEDDSGNLVNMTVAKGARTVIGFEDSVVSSACNKWCKTFFEFYAEYYDINGKTIEDVCAATDSILQSHPYYVYNTATLENYVIAGEKDFPQY